MSGLKLLKQPAGVGQGFVVEIEQREGGMVGQVILRDEFLDFCDQMNLDAILEPVKR